MAQRPGLLPPADDEHYDDLSELERERHGNDMRLKNTFEYIFDKYSRDFTDIGDEVDLETGEIIVNNGHLARLEDERDTGEDFEDWYDDSEQGEDVEYEHLYQHPYEAYEVADSGDEDELLSSPPRTRGQRVNAPADTFESVSTLTWQTSSIRRPPTATTPHQPRTTPHQIRTAPHQVRTTPHQPRTARSARPIPEPQRTPQRMDFARDPAFFEALGQSIAQGIAQYMTSYQDSPRSGDPVWDAPPLPRPARSARRPAPPPQHARQMIPESPRHPPSRSLWSTGRAVGRPRVQPRPAEQLPEPSPSVRSNALPRQPPIAPQPRPLPQASVVPERLRLRVPQWDEVDEGEDGEGVDGIGQHEENMTGTEYDDRGQVNAWVGDEDFMDFELRAEAANPTETIGAGRAAPAPFHTPDAASHKTQHIPVLRNGPDPVPVTPAAVTARPADTGKPDTLGTMAAQPDLSPASADTPNTKTRKILLRTAAWRPEDEELIIELKEGRKLSFPQICRYFPDRPPKSLENHWYKFLAKRQDKSRGPMSDYVRRALEQGPILANKARMKPYIPKNPANSKPHRANLTDPGEFLDPRLREVLDPRSEASARSTQELTATPTAQTPSGISPPRHAVPVTTPTPHALPANESPTDASPVEECDIPGVIATGNPERPLGCQRCGAAWSTRKGAKHHFADPARCFVLPPGRTTNRGRKPGKDVPPKKAVPLGLVPPGVDVTTGRPAPFNPNILIREQMERTFFCVLCGKSWASHTNARAHSKRPELCVEENWRANYDPGAHREKAVVEEQAGGDGKEGQSAKRQNKDNSVVAVGEAATEGEREGQPAKRRKNDNGVAVGEVVPDDTPVGQPSIRQKHVRAAQQSLGCAEREAPQVPLASSHVNATVQRSAEAVPRKAAQPESRRLVAVSKLPAEAVPQKAPQPTQNVQRARDATLEASPAPLRGPPERLAISDKQLAANGSSRQVPGQVPIAPMFADPSKVVKAAQQQSTGLPQQVLGFSPPVPQRSQASSARITNGESSSTGAIVAARDRVSFSSNNDVQTPSVQKRTSPAKATPQPAQPLMQEIESHEDDILSTPHAKQQFYQVASMSSAPRKVAGAKASSAANIQLPKPTPKPSLPKPIAKAVEDVRKEATSSKTTPVKATTSKPAPKKAAPQEAAPQSAKPVSKASSAKRPPAKPKANSTPQASSTGEAARSSPLSRVAKSEPRPRSSFIDLLADDSGDELAL